MHYFSHISFSYSTTNKLQKGVYELLKSKDRLLIDADKLSQFQKDLLAEIENLNRSNPRCKPIKAEFWKPGMGDNDYHLSMGVSICSFSLYASKN